MSMQAPAGIMTDNGTGNVMTPNMAGPPTGNPPPPPTHPIAPGVPVGGPPGNTVVVGNQGGGNTPPPPSAPGNPLSGGTGDPALDSYLGTDSTYQSQLSDLMRQYDQYNAQKNLTASQTQADYDAKERALNTQTAQDQLNMRNAAAARGILYSGIYANQLGQYNDANQQQMTNLLGGLQNAKDNAALQYNQFISNELAAKESAIQQAAARRAAQLGLV